MDSIRSLDSTTTVARSRLQTAYDFLLKNGLVSRGALYTTVLAVIIYAAMALAPHIAFATGGPPTGVDRPILVLVFLFTSTLLWLQPRLGPYALGVASLAVAFIGMWLASPNGITWYLQAGYDPSHTPVFGYVPLVSLPAGWVLLATSVVGWRKALTSYIIVGLAFMLVLTLVLNTRPTYELGLICVFWPYSLLRMLGIFGWSLG